MTPPLTDAELLYYAQRTPEWAQVDGMLVTEAEVRIAARAFYDHEQRVREEAAEAVGLLRTAALALEAATPDDCCGMSDCGDGKPVPIKDQIVCSIRDFLAKQGGK